MEFELHLPDGLIWWEDKDHHYYVEWMNSFAGEIAVVGSYRMPDQIGWANEHLPNSWTWV